MGILCVRIFIIILLHLFILSLLPQTKKKKPLIYSPKNINSTCDEQNLNATSDDASQSRQLSRSSTPLPTSDTCNENTNHDDFSKNTILNNDTKTDNGETVNDSIESNCTDEVDFEEFLRQTSQMECTNEIFGLFFQDQSADSTPRSESSKERHKQEKKERGLCLFIIFKL